MELNAMAQYDIWSMLSSLSRTHTERQLCPMRLYLIHRHRSLTAKSIQKKLVSQTRRNREATALTQQQEEKHKKREEDKKWDMETTSSLIKSVTRRVWSSAPAHQRPFRVCSHDRGTRKGITAGTLEELRERAKMLCLSSLAVVLVCEEDGTVVDSEDLLMSLPDNTVLMALEPGQTWKTPPGTTLSKAQDPNQPRTGKDIARVTFDLYRQNPKDVFGSLNVKGTFSGRYSISADFKYLGPKKVLREALRVASTLLQAAGHMLITSANLIKRLIEGAEFWQPQRAEVAEY